MELEFGNHKLSVKCLDTTLVSLNGQPHNVLSAGKHEITLRQFEGTVEFDQTGKKTPHVDVKSKLSQPGERLDDLPPPPPPPADNFLAMMRAKVRQEMGVTRENFERIPSPYEQSFAAGEWEEDLIERATKNVDNPQEILETPEKTTGEENVGTDQSQQSTDEQT